MRALPLMLLVALGAACPPLTQPGLDAGSGDGGAADAGLDGGEQQPTDAPLRWTAMVAPLGPGDSVRAVHGRALSDAYAVGSTDTVYRYEGSAWSAIAVPGLGGGTSVHVSPGGAVSIASKNALGHCSGNCGQATSYRVQPLPTNRRATAVCGLGDADLYAVGTEALLDHGVLWRYQGGQWVEALSDLGVPGAFDCWVAPSGTIFVAAGVDVVVVAGGSPAVEAVDLSSLTATQIANHAWHAVRGVGADVFVAGSGRRIARREGDGGWALVSAPTFDNELFALAAASSHQAYAAGASALAGATIVEWRPSANVWAAAGEPEPYASVTGLWAADVDTYLAVGHGPAGEARIWIGVR